MISNGLICPMKISVILVAVLVFVIINSIAVYSLGKVAKPTPTPHITDFYSIPLKTIEGDHSQLSVFKGKVILIVNVASKCGFTPQYKALETLYKTYESKGFVVLGFPCNNFLWQEPGSDSEIKQFCSLNYQVTFPLFSKLDVKGDKQHPLYHYLTSKSTNPHFYGPIKWNFTKFLINKEGRIINRFESPVSPLDPKVLQAIEAAL